MIESFLIVAFLAILIVIGGYFFLMNITQWKKVESDTIRAKAFLNKSFMKYNFSLTFLTGGLAIVHILVEPFETIGILEKSLLLTVLEEGGHIIIMLNLVLLAFLWYQLLHKKI